MIWFKSWTIHKRNELPSKGFFVSFIYHLKNLGNVHMAADMIRQLYL